MKRTFALSLVAALSVASPPAIAQVPKESIACAKALRENSKKNAACTERDAKAGPMDAKPTLAVHRPLSSPRLAPAPLEPHALTTIVKTPTVAVLAPPALVNAPAMKTSELAAPARHALTSHPTPQPAILAKPIADTTAQITPPRLPQTLRTVAPAPKSALAPYEAAQFVIYWKDAGDAALGAAVMAREFKLNPASENRLPNLGGVIATFKLASQHEAERVKNILIARFPTWRIDFHARYLPYQSLNAPPSMEPLRANAPSPRHFLNASINYITPAPDAGNGVRVGIVDTAVEMSVALKQNRIVQRSFLDSGEISASPAHGSALAALIAGRDDGNEFSGISPGAALYVASIMRLHGGGTASNTATLVRALDWLLGERVQIVNLSLGGAGDRIMEEVIARMLRSRVIIISAAGNQGDSAAPSYPAAYPGVIAVTASDAREQIFEQANRGSYVFLTAPGVDIWTPDKNGGRYVSGTSFAAAIVSGAVAAMLAHQPTLDAATVREMLCRHARDLGSVGTDPTFGCGLIQLQPTLNALVGKMEKSVRQ